ncbi:MAG: enoyl-CoA hydratase/isomerase family protein [Gammaproteobacteria bacterium]|nr:enoyl-CoA hydratase/isomerase family protein [Gammaproteobacteria bacterium]
MTQSILFNEIQGIGEITLNRPQAYNALTHQMVIELYQHLKKWEQDPAIHVVIIQSSHEKVFCAGGDIKALYEKAKNHDHTVLDFFQDEYRLNSLIKHYPKPYIALLDGLTLGGGVGLSVYAHHRIATEKYIFSMPETGIGFFPDIGASYFLSRCPEASGFYLGLTGARLKAAEALTLQLVDYLVPSATLDTLKNGLFSLKTHDHQAIHAYLSTFHTPSTSNTFLHSAINTCFQEKTVEGILEKLDLQQSNWAEDTKKTLFKKCPLSLKVTLEQLTRGKQLELDDCLTMEYTLVQHFLQNENFYEGIRAAVIDKDNQPHWSPPSLEEINEQQVNCFFENN